jgi:hypothetical protein
MKLEWIEIKVDANAYLDKQDSKMSLTKVDIVVSLIIPFGANFDPYQKLKKTA